jgi:hypothetical protein
MLSHIAKTASFLVVPLIKIHLLYSCTYVLYSMVVSSSFLLLTITDTDPRGSVVVKTLCYKTEGCGYDTR